MTAWTLVYEGYDPDQEPLREALCTLGNGYVASRGAVPESNAGAPHYPGTYVAGLYDRLVSRVSARDIENEDLVNVPNWLCLRFRPEGGDWYVPDDAEHLEYRQELDIRRGILTRILVFRDHDDRRTRVTQRRLVHMGNPHVLGLQTTFVAENWTGTMDVVSVLDGTVTNDGVSRYRSLAENHLEPIEARAIDDETDLLVVQTHQSRIRVGMAARTRALVDGDRRPVATRPLGGSGYVGHRLRLSLDQGTAVTVDKVVALFTSRDRAISEPGLEAHAWVGRSDDFDGLVSSHVMAWDHLWRRLAFETGASDRHALAMNLHVFHLVQTVSKHSIDLDVGVPARGLHGEAYRGHVFWDELFVFPFLTLHLPDLTRALLLYRYRRLGEARWNATRRGLPGALFPWQSGSNGREESQTVHLNPRSGRWIPDNSHLQRHVNHAIAYNVWHYHQVTGDTDFLAFYGAEMLVEISRMLVGLTSYDRSLDRYEILGVMGPDEYHDAYPGAEQPGLDNNTYTNVMTAWTLLRTRDALDQVPEYRRAELDGKLGIRPEELELWDDVARKLKVVFHDGVLSQFEGYEDLREFDWVGYTERYGDIQRLDRILEAEGDTSNAYKVSKQADVLMLFYLMSVDELAGLFAHLGYELDGELVDRTIEYYTARTSHGSTLSRVVHSWVLARRDRERTWELFRRALMSDMEDIQGGTTPEGIHLGAMAGTIDLVQRGYTGLEIRDGVLRLDPSVPDELGMLRCRIRFRDQWIQLEVTPREVTIRTAPGTGAEVTVEVWGRRLQLGTATTEVVTAQT